jgi:hypothetical protein
MNGQWLEPWVPVKSREARSTFETELCREVGAGHLLLGLSVAAVAKREDQDDVLFMLSDGRVAEVHLTWRGRQEVDARWPSTAIYPSAEVWIENRMKPDHEDLRGTG